jgi:putative nucleotidyltransferase with HDIG domain
MRIRVDSADLTLGMFVAELDRPWLESPFLFQGFVLEDDADLAQVRQVCRWVIVESDKSRGTVDFAALAERGDDRQVEDFREVARRTAATAKRTHEVVSEALDAVRFDHTIKPEAAQHVVNELVDEVAANTNAALWLTGLKKRHGRVATHCLNVCVLSLAFARYLGFPKEELREIGMGALLHDIGLGRLPPEVIDKPGPLDEAERAGIELHPEEGMKIMKATKLLSQRVLNIILQHHERVDGSGYPGHLKKDDVDRTVRIIAICDTYDAMTTDQPWRPALLPQIALTRMMKEAADPLGRDLVEQFIKCIGIYPIGSLVRLSTGALGVVLSSDPEARLKPMVLLVREPDGRESAPGTIVNLQAVARARKLDPWTISELLDPRELGLDVESKVTREVS